MRLAIGDISPCPNDALALPIGDEFCTSRWQLTDQGPCGEETQHVLRERQSQLGSFGRQCTFQLLWQVKHDTHGWCPCLNSHNHLLLPLPTCTSPLYGLLVCETTQSAGRTPAVSRARWPERRRSGGYWASAPVR